MLAARHVAGADVLLVGMGPGNLGTASRYGFAGIGSVDLLNAASALGAEVSLCARISFADRRPRHRGLSHHTRTIVELAAGRVRLPLPVLDADATQELRAAVDGLDADAIWIDPAPVVDALAQHDGLLRSMGRGYADDPAFFLAGAVAGLDALR
jgi:hypothetical protein